MFTKAELEKLQSCWILPDGKIYPVPNEQHDNYLPDAYYTKSNNFDYTASEVAQVEKKCFRMSFGWGWDAEISQMTIACDYLTDNQKSIIKYLLNAKIITWNQICVVSHSFSRNELLDEILEEYGLF